MNRSFRICFTSDTHGYLFPTDYLDHNEKKMGVLSLGASFHADDNTLIIDGGDTLQGSPLTNYYHRLSSSERDVAMPDAGTGADPFAIVMNACGYRYVTLGNHDFNMGLETLDRYLSHLDAKCVCCNIRDKAHKLPILPWDVCTLGNGIRVGIVGACTDFVRLWEKPETVDLLEIEDPFEACRKALHEIKPLCDVTLLIYHGGLERNLATDALLTESLENQGCRICKELDFDLVLTGHQHLSIPPQIYGNSMICQPGFRAKEFDDITVSIDSEGTVSAEGTVRKAEDAPLDLPARKLSTLQSQVQSWLDTPVGHLSRPVDVTDHISMAVNGCDLSNLINMILKDLTGAQISTVAMANEVKGLPEHVTIRDVVSAYIYSNTLLVMDLTVADLKRYMERCADYFALDEAGRPVVSDDFMYPKVAHFNYDYFYGVDYTMDLRKPSGNRIVSIRMDGRELREDEHVTVSVTSYRSNGTGGFDVLLKQPVVKDVQVDVCDAIIDYLLRHPEIEVDSHRYCTVLY